MFTPLSESHMHHIRIGLSTLWFILIVSLFFDPFSPALTQVNWSPFKIDPDRCIHIQGHCLSQQPYPISASIFWSFVIPTTLFILLVFGHQLWRRICPLSFISQLPRALNWQRKTQSNDRTPKGIPKISPNSWLGKNYALLQFSLLYLGLCGRILFYNGDRIALALLMIGTILAAIVVGYLFAGKSWCQYFCPMFSVQRIYTQPHGLFDYAQSQKMPESICRVVTSSGSDRPNCVVCQTTCIDINAEQDYWHRLHSPHTQFTYYGYTGLILGFFLYYFLYAGNWNYYFSAYWSQDQTQLQRLFNPGFYIAGQSIHLIPKLVAVPLTLGLSTLLGYVVGMILERICDRYFAQKSQTSTQLISRHRIFSSLTVFNWNLFFVFGGRTYILQMPIAFQVMYTLLLLYLSGRWLLHVWPLTPPQRIQTKIEAIA